MERLTTRDLAFVSMAAALWAVLNVTIVPVFWQATKLPILCDLIGVSLFAVTAWWTRRPGAVALMGGVATLLNFLMMPGATQFLGFTAAAIAFDAAATVIGYDRCCAKGKMGVVWIMSLSLASAFVAGLIIGSLFMVSATLAGYGGVIMFALLHAAGGGIGGAIGIALIHGLRSRGMETGKN
ncbi:MAG: hypothetical protein NTV61_06725 [Candidatus Bathyarchaeota archaeon]|nr:hypothetical protein [Candidatus Bathyarchaeota archaeon]